MCQQLTQRLKDPPWLQCCPAHSLSRLSSVPGEVLREPATSDFWPELSVSILEAFGHCTWLGTGQHFDYCQQFFMHQVHVAAFIWIGLAKKTYLLLLLYHISLCTTKLQHITHPTLFICFHGLFVLELNYSCITAIFPNFYCKDNNCLYR